MRKPGSYTGQIAQIASAALTALALSSGGVIAEPNEDVALVRDGGSRPPWKVYVVNHGQVPVAVDVQKMCGIYIGWGFKNATSSVKSYVVNPGSRVYVGTEPNESCKYTIYLATTFQSGHGDDGAAPDVSEDEPRRYYVTGRYACVNVSNGNGAGDCNITTYGPSCDAAFQQQENELSWRGDPCRICNPQIVDNTKRWSGQRTWIQAGACQGSR